MFHEKLTRDFFERCTVEVAQDLLGKVLKFKGYTGIITETEAYTQEEASCHAARGITKRNKAMFGKAGHVYVYFIYGMHHCMNIVTEKEGYGAAVLIRGVDVLSDINGASDLHVAIKLDGPGKICKFLGIDRNHDALDTVENSELGLYDFNIETKFSITSRIGISQAKEKPWRFVAQDYWLYEN